MLMPFDYMRVYRPEPKDDIEFYEYEDDEVVESKCRVEDCTLANATIDLSEIENMEEWHFDKRVTSLQTKSGYHILCLKSVEAMRVIMRNARKNYERKTLLTFKQ